MDQIKNYHGQDCNLSDEVYVITDAYAPKVMGQGSSYYRVGDYVRFIQSPEDEYVGQHYDPQWVQVCRIDANPAEFHGIEKKYLRLVDTVEGLRRRIDLNKNYIMRDPETKRDLPTIFTGQQVLNFIDVVLAEMPLVTPLYLPMLRETAERATLPDSPFGFRMETFGA